MASEIIELLENDENTRIQLRNMTQGNALLEIAGAGELFHDERKEAWIRIREGENMRSFAILGEGFSNWIMSRYQALSEKTILPAAVDRAARVLAARAMYHSPQYVLYNRGALRAKSGNEPAAGAPAEIANPAAQVAALPDPGLPELWLDLADSSGRAVRVGAQGWELVRQPPPLFRQYPHQQPLPVPVSGDIGELFAFLPEMPEWKQDLLLAWLTMAVYPFRPCPLLCLYGAQGAAKTTMARLLRELIDPSSADNFDFHLQFTHLPEILDHHALPVFDNVGALNKAQVNLLCRAVTGGSWSKRKLYSDSEDIVFRFRRPILLTALEIPSLAPDWLERCLLLPLDALSAGWRREEQELWAGFQAAQARLLGGLLDLVSRAMRAWPQVRLPQLPRMADFTRWGTAVMLARNKPAEYFSGLLADNQIRQSQEIAGSDPFAEAVILYIQATGKFQDSPAMLLHQLAHRYGRKNRAWPRSPNWVTRRLAELQLVLADHGIQFRSLRGHSSRTVELIYAANADSADAANESAPHPSETAAAASPAANELHDTIAELLRSLT